jgi:hypothetical protein
MVSSTTFLSSTSWPTLSSQQPSVCCPRCENGLGVERIRRGTIARSISHFIPLRAYKCYRCRRKFHQVKTDLGFLTTRLVTWSIRGVERDTRSVLEKAAQRRGKSLGRYMNEDILNLVERQFTDEQLPAGPLGVQKQIDQLSKIVDGIVKRLPK